MITLSRLIDTIRQIAATEPDFVYNIGSDPDSVCAYAPNRLNRCGCLVGEALRVLGVPDRVLADLDALAASFTPTQWGSIAAREALAHLVEADALSSPWVAYVQNVQDGGYSWGEAVAQADLVGARNGWVIA